MLDGDGKRVRNGGLIEATHKDGLSRYADSMRARPAPQKRALTIAVVLLLTFAISARPGSAVTAEKLRDLTFRVDLPNRYPQNFRTVGDVVFFTASDAGVFSLWRTDGTPEGTTPVETLPNHEIVFFADDGRRLFFLMGPFTEGLDLWVSDGTTGGTFRLTDGVHVVEEFYFRSPAHWLPEAGVLLFEGRTPGAESALWITDGTVGGTTPLVEGFSQIHHVVGSEREAYFRGVTEEDGVGRGRLWRTDGSPAGTRALDLDLANKWIVEYEMLDDVLLVVLEGIEPPTAALWRIAPGRSPLLLSDELLPPDGKRNWRAEVSVDLGRRKVLTLLAGYSDTLPTGGPVDVEMWSTDGTVAGTLRIDESEHFPVPRAEAGSAFVHFGSWTYFAGGGDGAGVEVWRSNGLPDGTERLTDLCPGPCDGIDRYRMSRFGSFLVVNGNDGEHGREPWVVPTDPAESPWMLGDLCPGPCGGGPVWAERVGRSVVLAVQGLATGSLLTFESNLTPEGTRILRRVHLDDYLGLDRAVLGNRLVLPVGERFEIDPWVIEGEAPLCDSASGAACLQEKRVEVSVRWSLSNGSSGEGQSVPMTDLAAYFWFFRPTNVELVAKLLDGCAVNRHRWLFVSGLTDVGVEIELRDLETGELERYENPVGRPFDAILDIEALSCNGVDH